MRQLAGHCSFLYSWVLKSGSKGADRHIDLCDKDAYVDQTGAAFGPSVDPAVLIEPYVCLEGVVVMAVAGAAVTSEGCASAAFCGTSLAVTCG